MSKFPPLPMSAIDKLITPVDSSEVTEAVFSMNGYKAPGLDGL